MWSAESGEDRVCCVVIVIAMPCPTWPFPFTLPSQKSVRSAEFHIYTQKHKTHAPVPRRLLTLPPCQEGPRGSLQPHQKERRPWRNLGKWDWCTYFQGTNRDADTENKLWQQLGKEKVGWIKRVVMKHTLPCVEWVADWRLLYSTGSSTWCSVII